MSYTVTWQDVVLMVGGFIFSLALIPAVRSREKPPLLTSLLTSTILGVFFIAYLTLGLGLAALSSLFTCTMWGTLLIQRLRRKSEL